MLYAKCHNFRILSPTQNKLFLFYQIISNLQPFNLSGLSQNLYEFIQFQIKVSYLHK